MTKLIFALDTSVFGAAERRMLYDIAPYTDVVKIGLEMMTAESQSGETLASEARRFVHEELGRDVMWDMKLLDVANTMEKAASNICRYGSRFFTLHANASDSALGGVAATAAKHGKVALAVTVLTDLDDPQCVSRFSGDARSTVRRYAKLALENGITGFVCSNLESPIIGVCAGVANVQSFTIVTPGIRPTWAVVPDEQKRVTTPAEAKEGGAHYIVVGRPISKPPASIGSSKRAAQLIWDELQGK